jgi:hypothetical protein
VKNPETGAFITREVWGEQAWPSEQAWLDYRRMRELERVAIRSMGGVGNGDGGY